MILGGKRWEYLRMIELNDGNGFVERYNLEFAHTDRVLSYADFLVNMSASADVLAQAKVEIALGAIPEGKNVRQIQRNSPFAFNSHHP